MIENCPECHHALHQGEHKFDDGLFEVWYCKSCGFRKEVAIDNKKIKQIPK